ncbi:MAG TPA: CHAT domain-containing protein [Ktedonobacterales bacterium]
MQYLNFDLEIEPGNGRDYPVAVRSQSGETHAILRFPFDELALKDALKDLQIALLRSSGLRRQVLLPEAQTVQTFGQRLFEALFTGEVLGLYDVNRSEAARQGLGVRLRLRILAPELAALPWEYLYDARLGSYICLSRNTPLVRYLEVAQAIQPLKVKPPLRILGVIASPGDQDQLDIERERRRMQEALSGLEQEGLVKLTWLEGQTWRDLQRAMRGGPWHIFHFIGHGGFNPRADEGVLALANEQGGTHLLSATQVGILLADHPSLRLALLNACEGARGGERDLFSSTSATLARRGIPAVLAMQYEITDRAAIEFTRAFYETLAGGMPVDEAVSEARKAIELGIANTLEWGTPVLYLRATDGILFDLPERPPSAIIQRHKTISRNLDTTLKPAAPTVTCPSCGEALPATAIFCGKCGTRMAASAPAASATQPAAAATPTLPVPTGEQIKQKMLLSRRKVLVGLGAAGLAAIAGGTTLLIVFRTTTPTYRGHTDAVTALEWSPDGKLIASASYDTTVQVWNASEPTQLFTYRGHRSKVWALTWAPDQQRIASASDDHTAQVWDALTGQNAATYSSHADALRAVAWSPDGLKIASGSYDKTVQVWDATTLQTLLTYSGHSGHVWAVRWSADGQHLASASADMTAQVWEPASGTLITTYPDHTGPVVALDWSPDNIHIATGSYDHTVQIWDARTGFHVLTYQGHSDLVLGIAWSPDGQHIASASQDKTVRVWDATTGQTLKVYSGHSSTVRALAWSPDGKHIASGSYDHTVQVWPVGLETGASGPSLPAGMATATPTPPVPAAASPTPTIPPEATPTSSR